MKRLLKASMMLILLLGVLAACGGEDSSADPDHSDNGGQPEASGDGASFEAMTLALGHAQPATDESHTHYFAARFKEIVEERTDGQVTINIHPNSELGGEREMTEGLLIGTLDITAVSTGPLGNFAPIVNALDFPFLFRDRDHVDSVLNGPIGDEINQELENEGLKVLGWAENGFRNITNNERPITHPDDLRGLSVRTMENEVHLNSFSEFGTAPTPMAFPELFGALQQGVVDGQENPYSIIVPNSFYEVQAYMTETGHFYSPLAMLISAEIYNSVSPELQAILTEAAQIAAQEEIQFVIDKEEEFRQIAMEHGMQIIRAGEFDFDAFFEAAQPVYDAFADQYGDILQRIIDTD